MPKRIQRRRTKGWKMPPNTVYVGRPTVFGNPFKEGDLHPDHGWPMSRGEAVKLYRSALCGGPIGDRIKLDKYVKEHGWVGSFDPTGELRGKNLACWCRLDQECHADVLLELANE